MNDTGPGLKCEHGIMRNTAKQNHPMTAYADRHKGRRAFLIGNGPSLTTDDLERLKGELTFAANKIYLAFEYTQWRPTYYAVEDKLVMVQNHEKIRHLKGVEKLLPAYLNKWVPEVADASYFDLIIDRFYPERPQFSVDATRCVYWGSTIIYTMIQLACHMGVREIYLVGVDHNFKTPDLRDPDDPNILISRGERNHFHPDYRKPGEKWFVPNLNVSIRSYEAARDAMAELGGVIYNATRGGKLDVFPRVDLDTVLEAYESRSRKRRTPN